ncbi:MAG: sugar ABC transporter permease [Spirochaetia bacterium]|nr:sugar ABC transporter permease [Spirochaetia bacterium]
MTINNWIEAPFVGLKNYFSVFSPGFGFLENFVSSFSYTIVFVVLAQISCYVLGMGAAIVLNASTFRGKNLVRGLLLFPFILPGVVSITNWRYMFSYDTGMINAFLIKTNLIENLPVWLVGDNAFWAILTTFIWIAWPFWFIVLLASLQTISHEYFEAASIDGATLMQKFRHIIIPLTAPVTRMVILLTFMWYFREFKVPFVMMGLSPSPEANLLALHIYTESFRLWNFSQGAVMAVTLSMVLMLFLALRMYVTKKERSL